MDYLFHGIHNFHGITISPTILVVFLLTGVIITVYAVMVVVFGRKEQATAAMKTMQLASFVFNHDGVEDPFDKTIKSGSLAIKKQVDSGVSAERIVSDFPWELRLFLFMRATGGTVEYIGEMPSVALKAIRLLLLTVLAPLYALISFLQVLFGGHRQFWQLHDTVFRRTAFSISLLRMLVCVVFMVIGLRYVYNANYARAHLYGLLVSGAGVVGLGSTLAVLWAIWREQTEWKDYWQERLLRIIAQSEQKASQGPTERDQQRHDLVNRAVDLFDHLEAQPNVPMPGNLRYYVIGYMVLQGFVVWLLNQQAIADLFEMIRAKVEGGS